MGSIRLYGQTASVIASDNTHILLWRNVSPLSLDGEAAVTLPSPRQTALEPQTF